MRKLDSTKATFIKVGEEAEKSSKKVKKANRDVAESSDQVTEAEKKKTRATENAALAAQRSAREQERQLRMLRAVARALEQEQRLQIDLARAKQVSDNLAAIQNTKALSDAKTTADFRSRMNRQRQQEEEKTSQVVRSAMKSMSDAIVTAANIENRVREQTAKARVQVAQAAVQQMRQQRASVDSIAQERSATANLIVALRQLGEARAIAARQNAARVGADPVLAGRGARASVASSIGTARAGQASREAEAQRRLEQASNAVSASFLRQVATALGLGRVYDLLAGGAGRATGALGHLWSGVGRLRVGLLNARFAMALFLGALTVGPIVQMADGMTALEARTRLYAARASDVPYILEKTFLTAQKARAPLEGVAKLYTRLAPLADQLGRSQTDLLRVVETVSKAFSIGGASAAEATSSAQQFAQAISSNRFGGDELRSVAENAPVLLQVIAEGVNSLNPALNLNAATFIKWAQAGNATSEIMVKALERSATRIDEIFAQMPVTIGQSMTLLGNSMQIAIEQIDKLAGEGGKKLSEMIAEIIVAFGSFVSSDDTIAVVVAALRGLIQTFEALGTVISVVSNYFPVLVAALTSVLIARSLPLIFALVRTQLLGMAAASVVAGSRMAFLSAAMTATQGAAVRAGVAIKSAFAFVGGPLGLLLIAAAATFSYFSSTIVTAQEAVNKFDDATSGMYNAVERAATFMKTFGIESAETEKILMRLSGVEQDQIKNLDEAGKAALLRAERERALTVALLRRAAAESVLTGTELNKSAAGNERLAGMIRFSAGNEQGQPFDNARADAANRERTAAFQRSLAEKLITGAPALSELADKIAGADIVIPPIAEGSGIAKVGADADKAAKKVDGLRGALKRVADLQAQMIGLSREVGAALVGKTGPGGQDELEAFRAQLEALSNYGVAPAVRSDGSMETIPETLAKITNATLRKAAADEVALAAQVALKKIETERTVAIIEQSREVNNAAAAQLASTAAADDASAVMVDFYESSDRSARAYSSALKRQSDIQFEAALAAEALRVAWDNGYTSIEAMPPALREATDAYLDFYRGLKIAEQAEKEAAQKREADETHAKKIADLNDHTAALNKGRDALLEYERAQRAAEILARGGPMMTPGQADSYAAAEISAEARNREAQRLSDRREELSLVRSGVEQRKIEERVLAMSDEHLRQWPDAGRKFADYMARAKVSIEVLQERMAAVAGTINDEIRSAFVDERDIDFSKITDALGKAIRETLYDNLVSKPVKVIVDAAVNVATVGLQRMLETFMSSGSQGGGFDFGQFLGQLSGGAGFNSKRAQAGNVDTGWSIITGNGGAPNTDGQANAARPAPAACWVSSAPLLAFPSSGGSERLSRSSGRWTN
ncbi:MAG: tape measure protein [Alphaproteobacteria bacterium]|nr:tape measure protein [Alphaproteobacteria bacterium]